MFFRQIESLIQRSKSASDLLQLLSLIIKTSFNHDPYIISLAVSSSTRVSINLARSVFDSLNVESPPLFAWNSLIRAYTETATPIESVKLFTRMRNSGLEPDKFTYPFVLKACGRCSMIREGKVVHSMVLKVGLNSDKYILNTLLRMYSACGEIELAEKVFDEMPLRDVVSWSSMIAGYVSCNCPSVAVKVFRHMKLANEVPNSVTLVSLLQALTRLSDEKTGKTVHSYIITNSIELDVSLGTALVEMYSRCGHVEEALRVFHSMKDKNLQTWTVMISGLADNGYGNKAIGVFTQMEQICLIPDSVSFSALLSACGRSGLIDEGKMLFGRMLTVYGIRPTIEHYGCMVDLYGRAGLIDAAYGIIRNMWMEPNGVILRSFLGSCKNHGRFILDDYVKKLLFKLEPELGANYVLAASVSSLSSSWDDAADLRTIMKQKGLNKVPGYSWVL
ncbi:PREDICTED: pentatricopeptide repeat-containing protein At5g66520-like [Tarenaya hassleriana]|uniref:pentatricopeptide repeat-containing protein At5g66520-like n=1 Tax=Tarenaya hassleriana TaxID=28532 RepID=UPI00053C89B3|nr:PREDICTED: pentatricopeptide repeat-containing protein At5g66520-like [Tarenaya hassleriana]XP_010535904.1 PREDICTED: pentatricopeptide repeat-containing protein At5g66520-like [Tarenaya hassleriana]